MCENKKMYYFDIRTIINFFYTVYQSLNMYVITCIRTYLRTYKLRIQQYYIILTISLLSPLAPLDNRNSITFACPYSAALDSGVSPHYNKT